MIALPNYDDQTYAEIVETARRRIPVIYPDWTDMNEHDPGITLIELFAWLKEMEQYQLNRITDKGYESMLKLLGVTLQGPVPSHTTAVFHNVPKSCHLPAGMRFQAAGKTVFECESGKNLSECRIKCVYVTQKDSFCSMNEMLHEKDVHFHIFGENQIEGVSALYIGLETAPQVLEFYLKIYDNYPVGRNPFGVRETSPRKVIYEYATEDDTGISYRQAELLSDKTHMLSVSGSVRLKIGNDAKSLSINPDLPVCVWLRVRLLETGCEEAPRLVGIYENTAALTQCRTRCQTVGAVCGAGNTAYELLLDTYLGQTGGIFALVRDADGWIMHSDFAVLPHGGSEQRTVQFKNLPSGLACDGVENLRLVCCEQDFGDTLLKGSNGLPCQRFPLNCGGLMLCERLHIMVEENKSGDKGSPRWFDWTYVPHFDHVGPLDRVFSFDAEREEIVFGDNVHGAVPSCGADNILITSCAVTEGSKGNILSDSLDPVSVGGVNLDRCSISPASGGYDGDTVRSATERMKNGMTECVKAVTADDYEKLVYQTPGLRVLGAKAIPGYDPENPYFGGGEYPATVTVVVMPYNESPLPKPDSRFIEAVRGYLEDYRLITTNVKVVAPSYIKISVYAEVVLQNGVEERTVSEIRSKLAQIFDIQKKTAAGIRPRFGETVRENALIAKISEVPGVSHVNKVKLSVRETEGNKDKYGNIELPPYCIPYLGSLEIQPLEST